MAAITLEADTDLMRVGVSLSAWTNGDTTIHRVHPDGTAYTVRGAQPFTVSGGVGFVWDYEAPFNEAVTYRAASGASTITSAAITLASTTAWLRAPGLPSLDMAVQLAERPRQLAYERPTSVRYPMGSSTAVVRSGALRAATFEFAVWARSFDEGDALHWLVGQAPVVLAVLPNTRSPWLYVHLGTPVEAPLTRYVNGSEDSQWTAWTLPCTVVARPSGDVFGDPSASWQAYVDAGLTWQQLSAYTWLDMLRGTPLGV